MIKVDNAKVEAEGNIVMLMAEVALGLNAVCELADKEGILTKEQARDAILQSIVFKDLRKAGMSEEEAREIIGAQ